MELYNKYPDLPISIILGFSEFVKNPNSTGSRGKKVMEFCSEYSKANNLKDFLQPRDVVALCEKFVQLNLLSSMHRGGIQGIENQYYCVLKDKTITTNRALQKEANQLYSYLLYGFPFIYQEFKHVIHPIINMDVNGDKSMGTCFEFGNGLLTARHNFDKATRISIKGFSEEELNKANYYSHTNDMVDIVYIEFQNYKPQKLVIPSEANIMDEVMTMGFPRVPGFHNFIAAEKATVSSRLTATIGQLTAKAEDLWVREKLILITARVKGGNSGGPVINKAGGVVGVVINDSQGDGNYDNLGYGTAIPMTLILHDIVGKNNSKTFEVGHIEFADFDE